MIVFLYQHVKEDTRFMNDQSSALDLAFTKEENEPPLGSSDHAIVTGDFITEWKSRVAHKPRRMYQKGNYTKISEGLDLINWDLVFEDKTVQECWDIFKAELATLVNNHILMSTPKDYNEPWMNKISDEIMEKEVPFMEEIH